MQKALDRIDNESPYEEFGGVHVIDTDYDNFMMLYSCHQFEAGMDDDDWSHVTQVTLYTRKADIPESE